MEKRPVNEELRKEFLEFIEAEEIDPPMAVSEKIHKAVDKELNPFLWKVFLKFGLVQTVASFMTLLFCPQFELDLGLVKHNDAHLRALLGDAGYMALCGAIFLGSGSLMASILLRVEELRTIKKSDYIYLFIASALALVIFRQLGTPTVPASYAAWFAGAFGGSAAVFEIIKRLRLIEGDAGPVSSI